MYVSFHPTGNNHHGSTEVVTGGEDATSQLVGRTESEHDALPSAGAVGGCFFFGDPPQVAH
jgi:hypothetical protein